MKFMGQLWLSILNALAASVPSFYYLLLWLLASLGHGFMLLFPLLSLFLAGFVAFIAYRLPPFDWLPLDWTVALGCLLVSGLAAWTTAAIFRTRPDLPAGRPLTREEFPELIHRIGELATTYNAPQIVHFKLTTDFAAGLVPTPRHGFPTDFDYTLTIGLPVMTVMSPLHLNLLLAREIGQLALARTRPNRRLVHLEHVWNAYAREYAQSWKPETLLLRLFFSGYAPLYRLSCVPARRMEVIVKDRCMLEITTAQRATEAIALFAIRKHLVENTFWPELDNLAYFEPKPTRLPYSSLGSFVRQRLDADTALAIYDEIVDKADPASGTQPPLFERLAALGQDRFDYPEVTTENAAHHFLGGALATIEQQLDKIWFLRNRAAWAQRYKQGIAERKQLQILRKQAAQALLSNREARRYLRLLEKYVSPEKALPLCYEILSSNALDSGVCFDVGRILISANDARGVEALKLAMDRSAELTVQCCQLIIKYMVHVGDMRQAQFYRRKILAHQVDS